MAKALADAEQLIKKEAWKEAIAILQSLLAPEKEDVFAEIKSKGPDGKEIVRLVSVRLEASRLIGSLPAKGMKTYLEEYEPVAKKLLKEAKKTEKEESYAKLSFQYFHTAAGAQATEWLAIRKMDRGDYFFAARYFERLLGHAQASKLSAQTLFHAALAFRRTGDKEKAEQVWKRVKSKVPKEGLRLGKRTLSVEELQKELDKAVPRPSLQPPFFPGCCK
jgi:tetratricopeptide (TPR) repeat protein